MEVAVKPPPMIAKSKRMIHDRYDVIEFIQFVKGGCRI
jgi:hypothetical protein